MRYDAILVGGGPAGSTAAWRLAREGARVLVLDAARFPRVKLCAGWVTRKVMAALELDPEHYPHTLQPFSRATLELGGRSFETGWDRTVGYGIVRREFDHFLLERARAAGAEVRDGERVRTIERRGDGMRVETDGARFEAAWALGAGGHHCPVARALGEISRAEAVVVTQESETRLGRDRLAGFAPRPGIPELFPEPDLRGYGWYFSKGDFLNVGLGALDDGAGLRRREREFVEHLRASGRLPGDLPLTPFRGHAYAIRVSGPRRIAGAGFLLLGDAAGLARDISGEGIGPAVESAGLAAAAVLRALGGDGERAAHEYRERVAERFGTGEASWLHGLLGLLPRAIPTGVGRAICRSPGPRRRWVFETAFGMG